MSITPNTTSETEKWLRRLGTKFLDVWVFYPEGNPQWRCEPQVNDPLTLAECVGDVMVRHGARFALWHNGSSWVLLQRFPRKIRTYPNREAAEMVAIHRG